MQCENIFDQNILELPKDALREAVVNAVCHRDYFEKGARVMVEIFDDRMDIVSPGGACKGITSDNFGTVSIARNSVVASMLYRADYIEQMGTGIMRMRNAAKEVNVPEPQFELSGFFKVIFKRAEIDSSIGHQSAANRLQSVAATDRKRAIISYLEEYKKGTSIDFVNIVGLSDGRVRALLREMVSDGLIEKVGKNRYTHYMLKR